MIKIYSLKECFLYGNVFLLSLAILIIIGIGVANAQVASFPYSTGFETGSFDGNWTTASTDATNGVMEVTTSYAPRSGSYHLVLGLSANQGSDQTQEASLAIDLDGETDVELSFYWKDFGDEDDAPDGIYFSDDNGSTFVKVQDLNGSEYLNNIWFKFVLDVDEIAAANALSLNEDFVIKFSQSDNAAFTGDGFAFDDLSVHVPASANPSFASFPYSTGFETGSFDSFWRSTTDNAAYGSVAIESTDTPYNGSYHMVMDVNDVSPFSGETTQEAWLYIDLSGQTEAELTFWWKDFADENDTEDGIYLSDDTGNTFVKVQGLEGESFANQTWVKYTLDLDVLADDNSLSLNDQFVIKFQQRGDTYATNDGFAFDDVSVHQPLGETMTYAAYPYTADFESGTLGGSWAVSGANPDFNVSRAEVTSSYSPYAGSYHLAFDNPSNIKTITSASLFVDLSGTTEDVGMEFWWKDFAEDTDPEDGIFLSDNGGETFVKVQDLNGDDFTDETWNYFLLNLTSIAAANSLTLNEKFVVKFQQFDNGPISSLSDGFAIDDLKLTSFSILPVELQRFNALTVDRGVQLDWATATESNNQYFSIERSADGKNFEAIGALDGAGSSVNTIEYSFLDSKPIFGTNYYRLKQVDVDGKFSYSKVVSAHFVSDNYSLTIYPSPAPIQEMDILAKNIGENTGILLKLYNLTGALLYTTDLTADLSGTIDTKLAPGLTLEPGTYMAVVYDGYSVNKIKIAVE